MARFLCGGRSALRLPDLTNEYEIEWITPRFAAVRTFKNRFRRLHAIAKPGSRAAASERLRQYGRSVRFGAWWPNRFLCALRQPLVHLPVMRVASGATPKRAQ